MNVSILVGGLTKDPELRQTQSGTSNCRFTVAVSRKYSKRGEEGKTDYISCIAWDKTAEFIAKYFQKGSKIGVQGSIQTGSYTNKDGKTVYTTDVNVTDAHFVGPKRDNDNLNSKRADVPYQGDFVVIEDSDDMPF